jgi:hypothetical protein
VLAPGDGWAQNFAVRALAGQMLRDGQLPLWNPYIFGGMPLMASVYGGAFYPPNWLFAILPSGLAMNIVVITTYHLALIGTYLYARRIGVERIGALLAGIAFTFGGFMITHLAQTSRIAAAAWLPWVLLAIENCRANCQFARASSAGPSRQPTLPNNPHYRKLWLWTTLGALFIALQFFAGEPQMLVFTALVAAPCALFAFLQIKRGAARTRFAIAIATMLLCGLLLSMIELLPARELLQQSERSDPGVQFFDSFSLPPWQLPGLIFPYFFGGAMLPPYRTPYWGKEIAAIMCGYVGMLTWLLALIAVFARNGRAIHFDSDRQEVVTTNIESNDRPWVWLWLGMALFSLLLALGGYLPFELNHLLYRIPGYNTFRGLYRHQFEFTFAMAMLAGLGMNSLLRLPKNLSRRAFIRGGGAMALIVITVSVLYRFFGESLSSVNPRPSQASSLANPEFLIPIACFVLSILALCFVQIRNPQSAIRNLLLVAILLLDVATYGHFFHWRIAEFDVSAKLADPPAVQLIKSRERDFNSFRVMSHMMLPYDYAYSWPEDPNYEAINQPNISILRGLHSISGYDILRPVRVGEITGTAGSAIRGFVQDPKSFGIDDRGLDLLNVKYLIVGHGGSTKGDHWLDYDGVKFARTNFNVEFKPGMRLSTEAGGGTATEIAVISTMANSTHLPDGAPVLTLRLHTRDGRVLERDLQAGRDTSEWAYDRADVKAAIKHQRARILESKPDVGFDSHFYIGRLSFDRAEIERIEWIYVREDASLYLIRASLHDSQTGASMPLAAYGFPPERWRKLARFDQVEVYENLRAMPRAWFVSSILTPSRTEILNTIKTGRIPASSAQFSPSQFAMIESEDNDGAIPRISNAKDSQVRITRYEPNRIELATSNPNAGFLVLSEVYYEGWEALVDGNPTKIYRTNYTLRGVTVPAGDHKVEFIYRPQSLRQGAVYSALGVMILLAGAIFSRLIKRQIKAA